MPERFERSASGTLTAGVYPRKICILDIETAQTSFRDPELCKIALVGVMTYTIRGGRCYGGQYRYFLPHQLKTLGHFLKAFPGIIIGHNILNFDYRVLRPLVPLRGVIERSVDTLWLLYKKRGELLGGLSLSGLAYNNLGMEKSLKGHNVGQLWRQGKRKLVIGYNRNDCKMTRALWWKMVTRRRIRLDYTAGAYEYHPAHCRGCQVTHVIEATTRRREYHYKDAILSGSDLAYLLGKRRAFRFSTWSSAIDSGPPIVTRQPPRRFARPSVACPRCGAHLPFRLAVCTYRVVGEIHNRSAARRILERRRTVR